MPKLVILKFDSGNFQDGFTVTLRIGNEGEPPSIETSIDFPPNPTIPEAYQRWQSHYLKLDARSRARRGKTGVIDNPKEILDQCQQSAQHLIAVFKNWLTNSALQKLREKLCQQLGNPTEVIRVIIQTDDLLLKKLPWHQWDLWVDTYSRAEVAVSPIQCEKPGVVLTINKTVVRILAIFGNSEGINIDKDKQSLTELQSQGADIQFLLEPKRTEISDHLWKQNWDILFFAGHSSSQGDKGRIFINRTDSLTIDELKLGLKKAINRGLQLAILNSCDGLKLAEDLADLNIPQVIVMREPVPDRVAQTFLQFFLQAFASGEPLYVAVRHARERLQENCWDTEFPGASGLPIIYQNLTVIPPSWEELKTPVGNGFRGSSRPLSPKPPSKEESDGGGIISNLGNVQFLLSHFLPGLIAGVAGLSLAVLLLVYRDIIAKDIFPKLTQLQATVVIFSIIGLTFFSVVIGIYAWLASRKSIQFKYVVVFMVLILTIFAFISVAFYMVTREPPSSDNGKHQVGPPPSHYLDAMEALKNNNRDIALELINRGLRETPKDAPIQVASLLALKIKVLLLIGGRENQTAANSVADQSYGRYLQVLDKWIDCLRNEHFFSSNFILTTETELETKCPSSLYQHNGKGISIFPL